MEERPHESFRQAILAWLDTADEADLIEVLALIQKLLTRRRIHRMPPPAPPAPETDQER